MALRFAYDGTLFSGFARQPGRHTIEGALLRALGKEGYVDGSWRPGSRTDRQVSALENVAACALERPHIRGLVPALQQHLPDGVWVLAAAETDAGWNPRYHALRTYQYVVPQEREDLAAMQAVCRRFVGRHDMRAFSRHEKHRDPVRTVTRCEVRDEGDWLFTVTSPGFLWNQVRRMVGAALAVGRRRAALDDVEAALRTGKADPRFQMPPAEGLVLAWVAYDEPPAWDPDAGSLHPRHLGPWRQRVAVRQRLFEALVEPAGP